VEVLEAARKREMPIFADLGTGAVRVAGRELLRYLRGVSWLLMNQTELLTLAEASSLSEGVARLREEGFHHAIKSGRSHLEAGRLANLAGALAATAIGAQGRLIRLEDLEVAVGQG